MRPRPGQMITKEVTDAGQEVVTALDKLMAVELASSDVARYGRIESLARITKSIRQRYATRVGDFAKPEPDGDGFRPLIGGAYMNGYPNNEEMALDEDDIGQPVNLGGVLQGGMGDMAQILRESMMMLQKTTEKTPPPPSVAAQLDELIHMRRQLKHAGLVEESEKLTPRIKELAAQAITAPVGQTSVFVPRVSVDDYLDPPSEEKAPDSPPLLTEPATIGSGG